MFSALLLSPVVGVVALVLIAALTGRKIEISPRRIIFWPRNIRQIKSVQNGAEQSVRVDRC